MLERDNRMLDSQIVSTLMGSVSFFASTTLFIIAGLILFLGAIGLLMFGIVEAASHLLASASPKGGDIWP